MRLQMQVPDNEVMTIRKFDAQVKEHFAQKKAKFIKDGESKMMLATMKNDQRAITKYNEALAELDTQRLHLFHNNIVRAAIALGLKEMEKLSSEKLLEASVKYGVPRGRPNGS